MSEILGLILARGGSKGLPGKNIKEMAGMPLICYSVKASLESRLLSRCIVSTDDHQIAETAKACGANIPFIRPEELSQDDTPAIAVVQHALSCLEDIEGYQPDAVALLEPTTPLRSAKHIDDCIDKFNESRCASVVTVTRVTRNPHNIFLVEGDRAARYFQTDKSYTRRQDLPNLWRINGLVYLTRTDVINNGSFLGDDIRVVFTEREESVSINDQFDFEINEYIIKKRQNDKK